MLTALKGAKISAPVNFFYIVKSCRKILRRGVHHLAGINQISVKRVHRSGQSNLLEGETSSYSEISGCQIHFEFWSWKSKSFSKAYIASSVTTAEARFPRQQLAPYISAA